MPPIIHIRPFNLSDYDAVYALWRRAGPGIHLRQSDTRAEIEKKLARDPDLFLVAEREGQIVGVVVGGWDGRRGLVYHLAVEPTYRRQGIGRALMEELERRLVAKGCLRCYLLVARDNREAIEFYRELGWEVMEGIVPMAKAFITDWGDLEDTL
ncbi:MAG: GNAT family acetyltransferase [Anaerolineae bacterium]